MHPRILAITALLAAPLLAQNFYVPDNLASVGNCNVIPFGSTSPTSAFGNVKYQTVVTTADLGNLPGVVTGLGFAACGAGASRHSTIEVVMDHIPAGTPLSTTFASNLTAGAVTVLQATDYAWHTTADNWVEIGLQNPFVYDGVSDLVIQVTATNSASPAGFHRRTRPRVYVTGWIGAPPLTGSADAAALRMEIDMLMARASTYGDGCIGGNGLAPAMTLLGTPQLGQTVTFQLTQGPATTLAFLATGLHNGAPFPLDFAFLGMPGCKQYFALAAAVAVFTDGAGAASQPAAVPANAALLGVLFYGQWACFDPPANSAGITTSDYGRVLLGN